ncbi:MAG TPA: hypothetical protein VKY22_28900 [Bradyrhizobium sp.]|nr:hypothetical protein [Bradyrhizobium sp.]
MIEAATALDEQSAFGINREKRPRYPVGWHISPSINEHRLRVNAKPWRRRSQMSGNVPLLRQLQFASPRRPM